MKSVPVGEVWMIERLGNPHRRIEAGVHFIIPYIDRVGEKLTPDTPRIVTASDNSEQNNTPS